MRGLRTPLLWLAVGLPLAGLAAPAAVQLDRANLEQRPGGLDAIAGVGDWLLTNGVLCAAVSDIGHEVGLSASGGWLVDLGHCGRNDDQFLYTHVLPAMARDRILPAREIEAHSDGERATLTVLRQDDTLQMSVRYSVERAEPEVLSLETRVTRVGDGEALPMLGQLWLHPHRVLTPYSLATGQPALSAGYEYSAFDRDDSADAIGAMLPADLTILVGGDKAGPGISYGIQSVSAERIDRDGKVEPLLQFTLVENDYTNQAWLTEGLWLGGGGKPGRLEMFQSLFMDLAQDESVVIRQRILVSDRSEVASITNRVYRGPWLSGKLDTDQARIAVFDGEGNPLTEARSDAAGNYRLRLPVGMDGVQLRVRTPWSEDQHVVVELTGSDQQIAPIHTRPPGKLRLPRGETMRLVFIGQGETPDPQFNSDLSGYALGGRPLPVSPQSNSIALVGDTADPREIALPAGRYRVYATRGTLYSVASQDLEIHPKQSVSLALEAPEPVVEVGQWVSADFHVHSGYSFDSATAPIDQLRSFVAQGADVLVATEHDNVVDLSGVASAAGLDDRLTVMGGAELTGMAQVGEAPRTMGHANVYPLAADPSTFAGGLPLHEGKRLHRVMGEIRSAHPQALVQLNHPRDVNAPDADLAYFDHLSRGEKFNPGLALGNVQNRSLLEPDPASGLRDLDFDVLELANGRDLALYQQVRADWLSLILQGEYRPAVASSDSHHAYDPVAMPRSFVAYEGPRQHPVDIAKVLDGVRQGRVFGSSGPIPRVVLRNDQGQQAGIGETASGSSFYLVLSADAAPWVDVSQAWVYLNGVVLKGGPIRKGQEWDLPIEVEQDSFITVEIYGEPGAAYSAVAPGYTPMAYTNPIWIDADGDGRWQPPGIATLPMAISDPGSLPGSPPAP